MFLVVTKKFMNMKVQEGVSGSHILQLILSLLFLCLCRSHAIPLNAMAPDISPTADPQPFLPLLAPDVSPTADPQPFLPLLAPSPLTPFTKGILPTLSGHCKLNFSAAESIMRITATDCWASFAPYLANVVCCPQFDATLVILLGQYSKFSGLLNLDSTNAEHCLSDFEKILESQGANSNLRKMCSIHPANFSEAACPVVDVNKFERIVDSSKLLAACGKLDHVNECCHQVCQSAILDAAKKIAMNGTLGTLPVNSTINDCKNIVFRWLANKLDPSSANAVLRGLSNCKVNKVCPLDFPNMKNLTTECEHTISNQTSCCKAVESYVAHLQEQSFITNLQAINCAASLGMRLQKANVTQNVYDLCRINLKDFSLQVGSQESGCLLPSLPSDVTYDKTSGIGFICDLNDNIEAPWPSVSFVPAGSCNETTKLPALPAATSAQGGLYSKNLIFRFLIISSTMALSLLEILVV